MVRGKILIQCPECLNLQLVNEKDTKHLCAYKMCEHIIPSEDFAECQRIIPEETRREVELLYHERNELFAIRSAFRTTMSDIQYQMYNYSKLPNQKTSCYLASNKISNVRIPAIENKIELIENEMSDYNFLYPIGVKYVSGYDFRKDVILGASGFEEDILPS